MAKLSLTDSASGYASTDTINANNDLIEAAIENTLSRDGTTPNTMSANLDMNSNRITNLPTAANNSEPITLGQAASLSCTSTALTSGAITSVLYPDTDGLTADGTTDDAANLQAIFDNAGPVGIMFQENLDIAIESAVSTGNFQNIDFNGATIYRSVNNAADSACLTFGTDCIVRNLNFVVPTGVTILRGVTIGARTKFINCTVTSVDQQNNLGTDQRYGLNVNGDDAVVQNCIVDKFDKAVRIESSDGVRVQGLTVSNYVTALRIDTCTNSSVSDYLCHTASANASQSAGHDGISVEDSSDMSFNNITISDCGEHGIYISHSTVVDGGYIWNGVRVTSPGQCGMKISGGVAARVQNVLVNGLHVIDCSSGTAAGTNEDGLRIEQADFITVNGYSLWNDADADNAYYGIYIRDCTEVSIKAPSIQLTAGPGIMIADEGSAETLSNIYIHSPIIKDAGTNGIEINAGTASTAIRNIIITDATILNPGTYGLSIDALNAGIIQPVTITGTVYSPGTGYYQNVNGNQDVLLKVRLTSAYSYEVHTTGTVTFDPYITRNIMNSAGGAITATLPDLDEQSAGQKATITMNNSTTASTLSVTSHLTSSPEVFTFNATTDVLILEWIGDKWITLYNNGVTV